MDIVLCIVIFLFWNHHFSMLQHFNLHRCPILSLEVYFVTPPCPLVTRASPYPPYRCYISSPFPVTSHNLLTSALHPSKAGSETINVTEALRPFQINPFPLPSSTNPLPLFAFNPPPRPRICQPTNPLDTFGHLFSTRLCRLFTTRRTLSSFHLPPGN